INGIDAIYDSLYPTRRYYGHFERMDIAFEEGDSSSFWENALRMTQFLVQSEADTSLEALLQEEIQVYPTANLIKSSLRMADRFWLMYQKYPNDTHLKITRLAFEQLDRWYDPYHRDEIQYSHLMAEQRSWIYKGLLRAYVADYERSAKQEALQLAFAASEQNKAFSLYKYIKRQSQLSFSGVPDTLVRREAGLKAKIAFFNAKLNPNLPDHQFQKWEKELKQLQGEYEALTQQIQRQYPRYYQLLHQNPVLLQDFQAMLGLREKGIVYTRADSVLYAFSFTRQNIDIQKIAFHESLEDSIVQFRERLFAHSRVNDTDPQSLVHGGSYQLYKRLLEPLLGDEQYDMLYVIPDDILALIPFEVLWTEPSTKRSPQERPYLIRKYPLSYAYSAGLCIEQNGIEPDFRFEEEPLAVFAPNYQEKVLTNMDTLVSKQLSYLVRAGLYDLEGARNEAEAISQYFNGTILLGQEASKERFVEIAPDYKLLHLAMHASVLPESPLLSKLIFADTPHDSLGRYLYAAELFALPLDAELVVLSACNTGYGKLQQGEGVMSLAKAFHYAGCPSVVMSLWQVPDQETQQLMTHFYAELKAGKSKSEALRSAKLAYLDQVKASELGHPFFWAGFVLSGNAQPLEKEFSLPPWLWALLALTFVSAGMLGWKKITNRQ
ncbi:MAG: CHAT domain-containing protein, partial [Bacteroidota bacterium]